MSFRVIAGAHSPEVAAEKIHQLLVRNGSLSNAEAQRAPGKVRPIL